MMAPELRILASQLHAIRGALLASAPIESVGIGFAGWIRGGGGRFILTWRDFILARDDDYLARGPGGAVVRPEFLAPAVKRVRTSGEALILCHTHPFSTHPSFSGIDDGGEDVLIPRVRDRAPDAPHGGMVLGQVGGSVRIWPADRDAAIDAALRIVGRPQRGAIDPRFDRQERAFGPGTSAALANVTIGIVGCGGLGWEAATLAWAHGVGRLILVDDDCVEAHNRPRLRGSRPGNDGLTKVDALSGLLRASREDGEIVAIAARVNDATARERLAEADLIICGTDNLASRLDVDRFARRLLIPVVDSGINVDLVDGSLRRVGGRVSVMQPHGACLLCMGVFSADDVAREADPLGYRGQDRREEAAVGSFNAVVAGLSVTEALLILLGLGSGDESSRYLAYDGLSGRVREIGTPSAGSCGTCGDLTGAVFGALP